MLPSPGTGWTVRNTFVEPLEGGERSRSDDDVSLRRSKSDSTLHSDVSNQSKAQSAASGTLYPKHIRWVSSSETDQEEIITGTSRSREYNSKKHKERSGSSSSDNKPCTDQFFKIGHNNPNFDFEEAMRVYHHVAALFDDEGIDPRQTIQDEYPGDKINRHIPLDPKTGEFLSLGTVMHVQGQNNCKCCVFHSQGKCHKGLACLFCHFPGCTSNPPRKGVRLGQKKRHQQRKKRLLEEQMAEAAMGKASGWDIHDDVQPVNVQPGGYRISL